MSKTIKNEAKALKISKRDNACLQCAFYPGEDSPFCNAPWTDGTIEDDNIDACFEGVYRYLTGMPAYHLAKLEAEPEKHLAVLSWIRKKGSK